MTIDSHQHFWKFDPVRDSWITEDMQKIRRDFLPEDLSIVLRENDVDGCVAVQADQSETETAFLANLAERQNMIKGVVGWVDLCDRQVSEKLSLYREKYDKIKGFRHIVQGEPDDHFLLRDDFCAGIAQLQSLGFTYDILIYPKQLPAALRFVEKFPEQRFVIDHLAKPFIKEGKLQPWATQIKEIARHPNVYCKVSGMVTEADWQNWNAEDLKPYLETVFEAFGTRRLMFGSDWPVCLVAAEYHRVKKVLTDYLQSFSEADKRAVMGGNAVDFYHL